ncbi:hypothetical protein C8R43DRAFT_1127671 [Mycena crocata]|nr:hypothetical protein C8R43DRAFT_1127671 [Mycena crocata]
MPPAARASRAKYRAQHRMELIIKERNRRENQSRANQNLDEFIRRCVRQNKAAQAAAKSEPHHSEAPEPDELMDDCWKLDRRLPKADGKIAPRTFLNSGYPVRYPDA